MDVPPWKLLRRMGLPWVNPDSVCVQAHSHGGAENGMHATWKRIPRKHALNHNHALFLEIEVKELSSWKLKKNTWYSLEKQPLPPSP